MATNVKSKKEESWGRYDFLGVAKYITAGSVFLVILSMLIIATKGLNYGVDFAGGIEVQAQFNKTVDAGHVRQFMTDLGFPHADRGPRDPLDESAHDPAG